MKRKENSMEVGENPFEAEKVDEAPMTMRASPFNQSALTRKRKKRESAGGSQSPRSKNSNKTTPRGTATGRASLIADSSLEGSLETELEDEEIEELKLKIKKDMKAIQKDKWNKE